MDVAGKTVVVTGAGAGIGLAMAKAFRQAGAHVAVADIDGDAAQAAAADLGGFGTRCDVADESQVVELVRGTEASLGPIDVFCSNAGIAVPGDPWSSDEMWERSWQVNVMSHVYAARAVLPTMLERGSGYLLQTASAAGLLTQVGSALYAVTKHAVVAFAEYLAITFGERGIGVSVLAPQAVRTAMTSDSQGGLVAAAAVDGMMEPDEVAEVALQGLAEERFMILPHPEVGTYFQRKALDYDRWISGMQRFQATLGVRPAEPS